jgi:hypothetical protein
MLVIHLTVLCVWLLNAQYAHINHSRILSLRTDNLYEY